jgi:hypothetical protein
VFHVRIGLDEGFSRSRSFAAEDNDCAVDGISERSCHDKFAARNKLPSQLEVFVSQRRAALNVIVHYVIKKDVVQKSPHRGKDTNFKSILGHAQFRNAT